ncbi:MAG: type II toxin-antitoxin system HicA family toxin, partial [Metallibacterium sp.]
LRRESRTVLTHHRVWLTILCNTPDAGSTSLAGFVDRSGKGSQRNFVHPKVAKPITISGALGDDAKHYQVRAVKRAVEESKS